MPHRGNVTWAAWIDALSEQDPCLGRIVKEAVVVQDAALHAGAKSTGATRACRRAFESAEQTLDTIRLGRIAPGTDRAWKRAADALRKFTTALDCSTGPSAAPDLSGLKISTRRARKRRKAS